MKPLIALFSLTFLIGCDGDSTNPNLSLSNFIKPDYTFNESILKCNLAPDQTLSSVERFIPKLLDNLLQMKDRPDELYFLFPIIDEQTETQIFEILFKYSNLLTLDSLSLILAELKFDDIAECIDTSFHKSLRLTNQTINSPSVIAEILECKYKAGYSYATMKLVIEQLTDALKNNNFSIDILYSESEMLPTSFQWTNIFSSMESRDDFVKSWQALKISEEIQGLLLEQSNCQASGVYRKYQLL